MMILMAGILQNLIMTPKPVISSQDHGTHVAGCAAAVTDNGTGVSAPGWNCRILPLKFSNDSNGSFSGDYPAAIYTLLI
ncbi:MAG: hypothetical protein CM1200mP10_11870 [Candidatus Neomarinimicrobiota bacterium]|nr:MAG: hypothetical protein CM1200mP10_11870 [Candidatus Neomarinimicrobiota bacterium]